MLQSTTRTNTVWSMVSVRCFVCCCLVALEQPAGTWLQMLAGPNVSSSLAGSFAGAEPARRNGPTDGGQSGRRQKAASREGGKDVCAREEVDGWLVADAAGAVDRSRQGDHKRSAAKRSEAKRNRNAPLDDSLALRPSRSCRHTLTTPSAHLHNCNTVT